MFMKKADPVDNGKNKNNRAKEPKAWYEATPREERPSDDSAPRRPKAEIELLLEKGRRVAIVHDHSRWEAIYWGREDGGHLLAYETEGHWILTRIDLHRVSGRVSVGDLISLTDIRRIERDLVEQNRVT